MKRIVSLIVVCSLLIAVVNTPFLGIINEYKVHAAKSKVKVWSGEADTSWFTDDKTSYDIYTAEELAGLCKLVEKGHSFEGITVNLKNNIKLNDTSNWKKWDNKPPKNVWARIGHEGGLFDVFPFMGCFNGNGHTISGLYIDTGDNIWGGKISAGLFGYTKGALIMNLEMKYSYVKATGTCGTVVGQSEDSILIDVCAEKCVIQSGENAGGLVGKSVHIDKTAGLFLAYLLPVVLAGVAFNPLLFIDSEWDLNGYGRTVLYSCSVDDVKIVSGLVVGGLIGSGGYENNTCIGIKDSYAANVTFDYVEEYGYLVGRQCEANEFVKIVNGYCYNCKNTKNAIVGENIQYVDKGAVTKVSKKKFYSKKFAKKLGNQFKYVEGKAPENKMSFKNK